MSDVNKTIAELLEKSTVPHLLKEVVLGLLDSLSEDSKRNILQSLTDEQKELESLKKMKARLVAKYRTAVEKVEEVGKGGVSGA